MKQTDITPARLVESGYREFVLEGHSYYANDNHAVTHNGFYWCLCNINFGRPYSTNVYINTMEELEQLIKEGK